MSEANDWTKELLCEPIGLGDVPSESVVKIPPIKRYKSKNRRKNPNLRISLRVGQVDGVEMND